MEESRQLMEPQQDSCNTLIIDGDAIPFIIGWNHREHVNVEEGEASVDSFMEEFLTITGAPHYLGILAADNSKCFRYDVYKYKTYKGGRPEKEGWIAFWEPIIRKRLIEKWGFVCAPVWLETDDIVAIMAKDNPKAIICSPDKDLRQIPGYFYNYKSFGTETSKGLETVTKDEAYKNFWMQVLTGDSTDNINGISGIGPAKADKILAECTASFMWPSKVKSEYQKAYGPYYGTLIFEETYRTILMFSEEHPLWDRLTNTYGFRKKDYEDSIRNTNEYVRSFRTEVE